MQYSNEPADQPGQDPLAGDIRALLDQPPAPVINANVRQAYREILGQTQSVEPEKAGRWQPLCDLLLSQHRDLLFGTVAASLLLGVVTGLLLPALWQSTEPDQSVVADILQTRGTSTAPASASHLAMSAEVWLESIAELLLQGRVSEARQQLAQFEARYPEPLFTNGTEK